jgi:hypothetical protein
MGGKTSMWNIVLYGTLPDISQADKTVWFGILLAKKMEKVTGDTEAALTAHGSEHRKTVKNINSSKLS